MVQRMKIRVGFVSNSSSSSFVIAKCYMNKEQIEKFKEFLKENSENFGEETWIRETELYFQGELSNHDELVMVFLDELGLSEFTSLYQ